MYIFQTLVPNSQTRCKSTLRTVFTGYNTTASSFCFCCMKSKKNSSVAFSSSSPKIGLDYVTITHWVNFISAMGNLFDSIITFGARYDKARYKLMPHSLIVLYCLFFCCMFFFLSRLASFWVTVSRIACFSASECVVVVTTLAGQYSWGDIVVIDGRTMSSKDKTQTLLVAYHAAWLFVKRLSRRQSTNTEPRELAWLDLAS